MDRRKSYETHLKLKVVEFAAQKGNRAAGRHFGVGELLVQAWRKDRQVGAVVSETNLPVMLVMVAKPQWPALEEKVAQWLDDQRKSGVGVNGAMIRLKVRQLAKLSRTVLEVWGVHDTPSLC